MDTESSGDVCSVRRLLVKFKMECPPKVLTDAAPHKLPHAPEGPIK